MTASAGDPRAGLNAAQVTELLDRLFPESRHEIGAYEVISCGDDRATVRLPFDDRFARPGGTVSGPTMFKLADMTSYVAIISRLGAAGIDAVTTTLTINFLNRPAPDVLICDVEVLRHGRRQVVCDGRIFSGDERLLVAQASCTYALPSTASQLSV